VAEPGVLLFSDVIGNTLYRWAPGATEATPLRRPSSHANGNTLDRRGRLVTCETSERRVSVAALGDAPQAVTDRYQGKRYNSPNDVVVHSSGAVYFTDPVLSARFATMLGLSEADLAPELPGPAVYRVDPVGTVHLLLDSLVVPNGLAFSPDERYCYVADSREKVVNRYEVRLDGSLANETLFVDMRGDDRPGVPDGMKVDEDGRLWTTGAGGVWVVAADGAVLGQFETNEHAANLAFGGPTFSTLYLCTGTTVSSVETRVRGIAPGSR
jgi:gluconolactonase